MNWPNKDMLVHGGGFEYEILRERHSQVTSLYQQVNSWDSMKELISDCL